jgi:hypothetical protein
VPFDLIDNPNGKKFRVWEEFFSRWEESFQSLLPNLTTLAIENAGL